VSIAPIVAGTDGSASAELAVARAGEIAAALDATLHIVMSYKDPERASYMAALGGVPIDTVGLEADVRTQAEGIVSQSKRRVAESGVRAETHVCCGEAAESLMTIAEGEGAQMIVVGNRGMAGARRVLGSVPNRISHHAPCSVLIVPTSGTD
jgi:nucleotide-binding universal stress UspA family protein